MSTKTKLIKIGVPVTLIVIGFIIMKALIASHPAAVNKIIGGRIPPITAFRNPRKQRVFFN